MQGNIRDPIEAKMSAINLIILLLASQRSAAFNLDLDTSVLHVGDQADSMFGFAVALHKYQRESWLLIGAPWYDTEQRRKGVRNSGAVFQCSTTESNRCEYVPFDRNGNSVLTQGQQLDEKSGQWFGASVRSSEQDGIVVACAPRYVWFSETLKRRDPVGTCFVARNRLTDFEEFSPCRTRYWGYHRQGSCQAGFDVAITKNGERMFIGAPGAFYWQGQIHSQSLVNRNKYRRTWEGSAREDDQYLGYSLAVGEFTGDDVQDIAIGVPKGVNYTGRIALYTHSLESIQNLTGYQLGSYFGYSLAVSDFNGDGLDDIVVGAPMYTDYEGRERKYEVGRVHVLLQNVHNKFRQVVTYTGEVSQGRFGLSVANLGDIDYDGYGDIAVGAPYGGLGGAGAVFIYQGFPIVWGEKGSPERKKPAQVIYAEDISGAISTFGWSLSGGVDVDENQYPDLLVGAYDANSAVLFKARPVIKFENASLVFKGESKSITLEVTHPYYANRSICPPLELCLTYSGVAVPEQIELMVQFILDGATGKRRLFFAENNNFTIAKTMTLKNKVNKCLLLEVYANRLLEDKLSPMTASVKYALQDSTQKRRRKRRHIQPILDQKEEISLQDSLTVQKNCGVDNVCVPDLVLSFHAPDSFVLDKKEQLQVDVKVDNKGEDAFEAAVFIPVPAGLLYNKLIPKGNLSVTCSPRNTAGNSAIKCDIGNPLHGRQTVDFSLLFQLSQSLEQPKFEFEVSANSTNAESIGTDRDNFVRKTIIVEVDTKFILYGNSDPETLQYNESLYLSEGFKGEEDIGPEIIHKYGLDNRGHSDILDAEIVIIWPSRVKNGNYLLYLMENPITPSSVKCKPVPDVNPLNLRASSSKKVQSLLKLEGEDLQAKDALESAGEHEDHSASSGESYSSRSVEKEDSRSSASSSSSTYYTSSSSSASSSSSSRTYKTSYSSASHNSLGEGAAVSRKERDVGSILSWERETNYCGDETICTKIVCKTGIIEAGQIVYIAVRSRLWLQTLLEGSPFPYEEVTITSKMVTRITKLPHSVNPDYLEVKRINVSTPVSSVKALEEVAVSWWWIVLAIVLGILILLIIVLICWKLGFFERNRPQHSSESAQPLNPNNVYNNGRNGHHGVSPMGRSFYPGDEAL